MITASLARRRGEADENAIASQCLAAFDHSRRQAVFGLQRAKAEVERLNANIDEIRPDIDLSAVPAALAALERVFLQIDLTRVEDQLRLRAAVCAFQNLVKHVAVLKELIGQECATASEAAP